MKILELRAKNYKRLVAVAISPTGSMVEIAGRNAQGKSSVLDSIWAALGGADAIPGKPIRKGEQRAEISLKLGTGETVEFVVRRTFASKEDGGFTTSVVVENAKGLIYKSPQTLLDGLLGALSFDPLEFTRMDPRKQLEQLRRFVPDVDFDAIDETRRAYYEERASVNRLVKSLQAQVEALKVPGDPRQERVDESALVAELEAVGEAKTAIVKEENDRQVMARLINEDRERAASKRALAAARRERIEKMRAEIADLERIAAESDDEAKDYDEEASEVEARLSALPPIATPPDTSALKARIDAARKTNADVAERERVLRARDALSAQLDKHEKAAEELTAEIKKTDAHKAKAIAAANLPVPGLTFGDDEALLNGLPLDQASDAERLRVSVAIAAAMNSTLRVIRVRDGSLLDDDGMKLLREFAEKHDLQVWIERVANDAQVGVVIEDGHVKASVEAEAAA